MKFYKRLIIALSFALVVGILALWALSYKRADVFGSYDDHSLIIAQVKGSVLVGMGSLQTRNEHHRVERYEGPEAIQGIANIAWGYVYGDVAETESSRAGFAFVNTMPFADGRRNWCVVFPHWAVVCCAFIVPTTLIARLLAAGRRRRPGLCQSCGYDLRGSPLRCPECGWVADGLVR